MTVPEALIRAKKYDEHKGLFTSRFTPFNPGTRTLPVGFLFSKRYAPLTQPLVFEKDTAVKLRDGTTIYTDVFRPEGDGPFPAVVAWSPYGKTSGTSKPYTLLRWLAGVDQHKLSGLMKWEAPDPAFWCARGYAVCNPDARGACRSEGDIQVFGEQEGRDAHDYIEWIAEQKWSTGKVAMAGNSWLAISQWFAAAERPPHLAAIAPWEGFSDLYRDIMMVGGIEDAGFISNVAKGQVGHNNSENPPLALSARPLYGDDYWLSKTANIEDIDVPAYVVGSYSNTVHTTGTFRAWNRLRSEHRWLRIHNNLEWPDFYEEANQQDLVRFMDHFLKGEDNGWEDTPRVRYSLLDLKGGDQVGISAPEFPPPGVAPTEFHLDGDAKTLTPDSPADEKKVSYDAASRHGKVEYLIAFDEETHIVGYPKVKLWMEADGHNDMDVFVFLEKLDTNGKHLEVQNSVNHNPLVKFMTSRAASVLYYHAAPGRLRASARHLDPDRSTDDIPFPSLDRVEKLTPGQIVELDIAIYPVGLIMHPGEKLRLVITGQNLAGPIMPAAHNPVTDNHGHHIIHTGGQYDSHLVLPIQRPES